MSLKITLRVLIVIAAVIGSAFSFRSAWLGYSLIRPALFWDQIVSLAEYFVFLDGNFGIQSLLRLHNEHRIAVPRVLFLVDAIYFELSNRFLIGFIYASLLAITVIIAALTLRVRTFRSVVITTLIGLGIGWSISQHENLGWGFQTPFPLVHLFAIACYACVLKLLDADRTSLRWFWFGLAILTDALGLLSSAGGLLIGLATLAICMWDRKMNRWVALFGMLHVGMMILYLAPGLPPNPDVQPVGINYMIAFFVRCLAAIMRAEPRATIIYGLLIVVLVSSISVRSLTHRPDRASILLLAISLFIILETGATAFGRAGYGADQALNSRYATQSAILVMCLLAVCWRNSSSDTLRVLILAGVIAIVFVSNGSINAREWRANIAARDTAMFAFTNGVYPPSQLRAIFANRPDLVETYYKKLALLMKGPFALSAGVYNPPMNSLSGLDFANLSTCIGSVDLNKDEKEFTEIQGWILSPDFRAPSWLMVFSDNAQLLAHSTPTIGRPDLLPFYKQLTDIFAGFDLFLRPHHGHSATLIALYEEPSGACSLPLKEN